MSLSIVFAALASYGCGGSSSSGGGTGGKGNVGTGGGSGGTTASTGGAGGSSTGGAPVSSSGGSVATGGVPGATGGGGGSGTGGQGGASSGTGGGTAGAAGAMGGNGGGSGASTARATIMPINSGTITGTAVFTNVAGGVQVTINLANCPAGTHGIHIHEGTACTDNTTQGQHWGGSGTAQSPSRGEGIGNGTGEITCNAQMVGGPLVYTRMDTPANLRWTIGGPTASNVIGHSIVVHGLTSADRHGCGMVQAD